MKIKNLFYQTGKILYKVVEFPFNILRGYPNHENPEKIRERGKIKAEIKSLESKLKEKKEDLAYQLLKKINSNYRND
ncbi:MAG: hypothetical protein Q8O84_02315 [Nanoarchaeota archaeon]|nr:hypothetical protein [Nanoarchaeota archaeon]